MANFENIENRESKKERLNQESVDLFKKGIDSGEIKLNQDVELFAGNNSESAREFKRKSFEGISDPNARREFAEGISGDDSAEAQSWRESILSQPHGEDFYARSVAGEKKTPEVWNTLKQIMEKGAALDPILRGLAGDDSDEAWQMREKMAERVLGGEEWPVAGSLCQSLAGIDSPRADKMRDVLGSYLKTESKLSGVRNPGEVNPETAAQIMKGEKVEGHDLISLAHALAGVDSAYAKKFRDGLISEMDGPAKLEAVVISVNGLDNSESDEIRNSVLSKLKEKEFPNRDYFLELLAKGLGGVESTRADEMRLELEDMKISKKALIASRNRDFVLYHKAL